MSIASSNSKQKIPCRGYKMLPWVRYPAMTPTLWVVMRIQIQIWRSRYDEGWAWYNWDGFTVRMVQIESSYVTSVLTLMCILIDQSEFVYAVIGLLFRDPLGCYYVLLYNGQTFRDINWENTYYESLQTNKTWKVHGAKVNGRIRCIFHNLTAHPTGPFSQTLPILREYFRVANHRVRYIADGNTRYPCF